MGKEGAHGLRLLPISLRASVNLYIRALNRLYESLLATAKSEEAFERQRKKTLTGGPLAR